MKGRVFFWKRDFNNPKNTLFGWGFILPDGCGTKTSERVYFNETRARYSPVRVGDMVEFEVFKPSGKFPSKAACSVEKIDDKEDQTETSGSLHQVEAVVTLPGELEADFN